MPQAHLYFLKYWMKCCLFFVLIMEIRPVSMRKDDLHAKPWNRPGAGFLKQSAQNPARSFSLPEEVIVTTYDGRAFLQATDKKYDLIMVDAYQDITIPFQMSSVEFFDQVSRHLTDDGAMVVNLNMRSDEPGNINEYLCDTIASVFPEVYTVDVPHSENRELFAFHDEAQVERLYGFLSHDAQLRNQILTVRDAMKEYEGGDLIFTDDQAPVELLGMKVIDSMIGSELQYFKDIMEEDGLSGLIRAILS